MFLVHENVQKKDKKVAPEIAESVNCIDLHLVSNVQGRKKREQL